MLSHVRRRAPGTHAVYVAAWSPALDVSAARARYLALRFDMPDDSSNDDSRPRRSQPPVPLALAAFAASVVGFMLVVVALFALMRFVGRVH